MLRRQSVFRASIHENLQLAELMYGGCFDYRCVAQAHLFCETCLRYIFNTDRQEAKRKHTSVLIWRMLCLNLCLEQIRCMANANKLNSSLAVSHVNRICHRMTMSSP